MFRTHDLKLLLDNHFYSAVSNIMLFLLLVLSIAVLSTALSAGDRFETEMVAMRDGGKTLSLG
jgi:hypothetical protein